MNFHSRLAAPLCLAAATAIAEPVLKPITLDDCVKMALEKNLDLRIARFSPQLSDLELGASYTDYLDPTYRFSANQAYNKSPSQNLPGQAVIQGAESWQEQYSTGVGGYLPTGMNYSLSGSVQRDSGTRFFPDGTPIDAGFTYSPSARVNVTQPLLKNFWIDRFRLTIELNKRTLKSSEQDVLNQAIQSLTAVANAYYELAAARENVTVQRKAVELAEEQLSQNKTRVSVGTMAQLDEKQAESQVASVRADLINAENAYRIAQNALKQLVSDDFASLSDFYFDPIGTLSAEPALLNKQDSWHKGLLARPDIIQAKLKLEKQHIQVRYQKNQVFPQLDLTGSYGVLGRDPSLSSAIGQVGDRNNPNFGIGLVLSYPLSNRSARNRLKESKLQAEQYLLQYKQLEQSVMIDIANGVGGAQSAFERVQATKAAEKYAELAYEAEKKKLENGKSTSFVVLQLQRDLTTARSNAIRAVADYNKALSGLYQSEGSTLDRFGVKVRTY